MAEQDQGFDADGFADALMAARITLGDNSASSEPEPPDTKHVVAVQVDPEALERLAALNTQMAVEVALDPQERPPGLYQAMTAEFVMLTRRVLGWT